MPDEQDVPNEVSEDLLTAGGFISIRVHATVGLVLMLTFAIGRRARALAPRMPGGPIRGRMS